MCTLNTLTWPNELCTTPKKKKQKKLSQCAPLIIFFIFYLFAVVTAMQCTGLCMSSVRRALSRESSTWRGGTPPTCWPTRSPSLTTPGSRAASPPGTSSWRWTKPWTKALRISILPRRAFSDVLNTCQVMKEGNVLYNDALNTLKFTVMWRQTIQIAR